MPGSTEKRGVGVSIASPTVDTSRRMDEQRGWILRSVSRRSRVSFESFHQLVDERDCLAQLVSANIARDATGERVLQRPDDHDRDPRSQPSCRRQAMLGRRVAGARRLTALVADAKRVLREV